MAKRGKVGCGGREIMAALWGSRGRPETNEWVARCADRQVAHAAAKYEALRVIATLVPEPQTGRLVETSSQLVESPRTSSKWAAARARHRNQEGE